MFSFPVCTGAYTTNKHYTLTYFLVIKLNFVFNITPTF